MSNSHCFEAHSQKLANSRKAVRERTLCSFPQIADLRTVDYDAVSKLSCLYQNASDFVGLCFYSPKHYLGFDIDSDIRVIYFTIYINDLRYSSPTTRFQPLNHSFQYSISLPSSQEVSSPERYVRMISM